VAIALENARLIEETEKRAQRERTINRITSRIRNAPSIDQMLAVAAQELRAETRAARSVAEIAPEAAGQEDARS
jgi:GAF domain-containing protein